MDDSHYAPTHTGKSYCYTSCFERLGFKITASTIPKRDMLISHLKIHVDGTVYTFLRSTNNEAAFKIMVSEFLVEHGQEYWGSLNREHLAEPDVSKGFLYPRDAKGSRLIEALEDLFDYKARSRVGHMGRSYGPNWINKHVNYEAMTGRKADALALPSVEPRPKSKPNKRRHSPEVPHEGYDEYGNEDMGNDKEARTGSWNVFDTVETKTRLRPSPIVTSKWNRHVSEDQEDEVLPVQQPKVKKRRPRMSAQRFPQQSINSAKVGGKEAARTAIGEKPLESRSASEQPLSHRRRQAQPQPFTPPMSHAPSATPATSNHPLVVDLDSSPEIELSKRQASNDKPLSPKNTHRMTSFKTEITSANVKGEPMFAGHREKTILTVRASNDDKAPITVPFAAWKKSEELFSALIQEQGLRPEVGKKVKQISATYTWNKRRHGIRRGREEDWERFCKTVQKAWDVESEKFDDECEIEMVIHVDE